MLDSIYSYLGADATPMDKAYLTIAILASLIFIIQMIMTFVGFDADGGGDADADFDTGGYNILTVKSLVTFLLGFGWTGVLLRNSIKSNGLLAVVAVGVGIVFVFLILLIMKQVMKLSVDNSFTMSKSEGCIGSIYLRVPGHRQGHGLIQVSVDGSVHELDAMTDGSELPTGSKARVVAAIDATTVLVEGV